MYSAFSLGHTLINYIVHDTIMIFVKNSQSRHIGGCIAGTYW